MLRAISKRSHCVSCIAWVPSASPMLKRIGGVCATGFALPLGGGRICGQCLFCFLFVCVWARWRCECYLCLWVGRSSVPLHVVARCLWHVVGGLSDFVELRLRRREGAREPCVAAEARGRRFVCSFCCSQPFAIETVGCRPTVFAGAWPTPAGGAFIAGCAVCVVRSSCRLVALVDWLV